MTDESVVETDGVRVTKSFDADGFPVPAVRFDVTSSLDDETNLTITDAIPDEFDIDQIGFHPEYGSEHWTATGDGIVRFERSIEPNEEFTTVYGVRMGDDEEPSAFLDSPTVAVGESTDTTGIEDVVPQESSDIVRELASGKRETIPGLEAEVGETADDAPAEANEPLLDALHEDSGEIVDAEAVEATVTSPEGDTESAVVEDVESVDESDDPGPTVAEIAAGGPASEDSTHQPAETEPEPEPTSESPDTPSNEERTETVDDPDTDATKPAPDTVQPSANITASDVAAALAAQIRDGDVDDDDLDVLREELAPKRASVQIEHLQTRVSEMEAYADALGAFIDENGEARGILEDLQADVQSMQTTVGSLESSLETADTERTELRETLTEVEEELAGLDDVEERIDRVSGDVDALDDRLAGVEESTERIDDLSEEIDDLHTEIREMKQWRDQLSDVFGG